MLSKKHVEEICLLYVGHKMCRYLIWDRQSDKYVCCKKVQSLKEEIDNRVEGHIDRAVKNGNDLSSSGRPVGDNCQGYLYLKNTLQGYDVPGSA